MSAPRRSLSSHLAVRALHVGGILIFALPLQAPTWAQPLGAEFQVNTYTTSYQRWPAVGPDGAGGFVVVWHSAGSSGTDTSSYSVQGQRYTSMGAAVGAEFQVNTYTTSYQRFPAVGPDGAGGFVVVWESTGSSGTDTSDRSVQGQRYTSAGTAVGTEFQVNTYTTSDQRFPAVGPDGAGGFVVVWQSGAIRGEDVRGQRYTSAGTAVGAEFQVNTYTTSTQYVPAVGSDGAGGFVVVWGSFGSSGTDTSFTSIEGQRYDSTGTAVGAEFQVNTYTTDGQGEPAVAPDGAGGFVVVWTSQGSSGTDRNFNSVQGQRYTSAGAAVGAEFQVNTYTIYGQYRPAVGADGPAGFVVVWASYGSSGTDANMSVQGQRYTSAGAAVGAEFQVNTYTTNYQGTSAVGPDGAGGFVVVWDSRGSSGTDTSLASIQGQRFAAAATTTTISTTTSTTTTTLFCVESTELDGCRSRSNACTSFFRAELESGLAYCATEPEYTRRDEALCRRAYRREFLKDRARCAELLRSCRTCCRSGDDQACAVARKIECDVGCETSYETWKDRVRELKAKCLAAGESAYPGESKEQRLARKFHRRICKKEVHWLTNVRALKLARTNCRACCELGNHALSCQVPPVLCGDDVVGAGEECDGHDDAACPGRCAITCDCPFSTAGSVREPHIRGTVSDSH
jgi:hypothetical protein